MLHIIECYKKVNKACIKFIKSQETSKEKFKNKEKMIKSFLIPISFWIAKKVEKKKPFILGLSGGQGSGKTTISSIISIILSKYFELNVFKISIDDFYKTNKERIELSNKIHPLLKIRGVPGTHDTYSMFSFFKKIKSKNFKNFSTPKFDKSIDDRCNKKLWYKIKSKPNVIVFEGWCVGARHQKNFELKKPLNLTERSYDASQVWRKYVNTQLKKRYKKLFNQIDCLLYLKVRNFSLLRNWRLKQEKKLLLKNKNKNKNKLKIMNKKEIINFMATYQRLTQHMFKDTPKISSIIINLNNKQKIEKIKFN